MLASAQAFCPSPTFVSRTKSLALHPDQAADLEACAYDLMKAAAEKKAETAQTVVVETPAGPIAWCRRILSKSTADTKVTADQIGTNN